MPIRSRRTPAASTPNTERLTLKAKLFPSRTPVLSRDFDDDGEEELIIREARSGHIFDSTAKLIT